MNEITALHLVGLNQQFYQTFGREFSSTRQRLQPGVRCILDTLQGEESILDIGCGNGGLGHELKRRGHHGSYLGIDFSLALLEEAGTSHPDDQSVFIKADLSSPGWDQQVSAVRAEPFDFVVAFAVLHHIPGVRRRKEILKKVHALLRPGGLFIHSEWQFLNSEKWKERIQDWKEVNLTQEEVEVGDTLLDWRGGGRGLRYVHNFNEEELQDLAEGSGFQVKRTFHSDGENGRLGLYQVWEAQ